MEEDGLVRSHLRWQIAVFGEGDVLRAKEAICCFELRLRDGTRRLICARERKFLERMRKRLIEYEGDCSEITDPPACKSQPWPGSFQGWKGFDNAHNHLQCEFLKWACINGEYRRPEKSVFGRDELEEVLNRLPLPYRHPRFGGPVPKPPPKKCQTCGGEGKTLSPGFGYGTPEGRSRVCPTCNGTGKAGPPTAA